MMNYPTLLIPKPSQNLVPGLVFTAESQVVGPGPKSRFLGVLLSAMENQEK